MKRIDERASGFRGLVQKDAASSLQMRSISRVT
jgi:hypothetical protein